MISTRLITSLGLAIAVLASGCGGSEGPSAKAAPAAERQAATATTKLSPGRIAFRRYLDDAQTHGAIFTVRTDGTGEQQLTQPEEGWIDDHPDWSPDGRQIAYQSCAEGKPCSVWTGGADGGKPRKVRFHCRLKGDCDAAARRGRRTDASSSRSPRAACGSSTASRRSSGPTSS